MGNKKKSNYEVYFTQKSGKFNEGVLKFGPNMGKSRENCWYFRNLNLEGYAENRFKKLAANGDIIINGLLICDANTPITMSQINKELDLSCYGPDDSRCPGFKSNQVVL